MNKDDIKTILVVGAGVMGHGIAQVFAQAGYAVRLTDPDHGALDRALEQIRSSMKVLAREGKLDKEAIPGVLDRIRIDTDISAAAAGADFVVEAVPEVAEIKKEVFSKLDSLCSADTIFATNTSGLDVFGAVEISNPSRLIAAHFFAPAQIIPLVEVCPGPLTSREAVDVTVELMKEINKEPVVLRQFVPSFIVNRIQNYISMAVFEILNNKWATPDEIDRAVKASLGIRLPVVGVVQSLDFTGLDLVNDIMKSKGVTMPLIDDKVARGDLGVKTSRGFYDYKGLSEEEILEKRDIRYLRMLDQLRIINNFESI